MELSVSNNQVAQQKDVKRSFSIETQGLEGKKRQADQEIYQNISSSQISRQRICKQQAQTKWSQQEDLALLFLKNEAEKQNKKISWKDISSRLNQQFHNGIQIRNRLHTRQRFYNRLDPNLIKGGWSHSEDLMILELKKQGEAWCAIKNKLKGRNDHQVKNRYFQLVKEFSKENQFIKKLFEAVFQVNDFEDYVKNFVIEERNSKISQIYKK